MQDKLTGEMMDLQHGSAFMKNATINASVGNLPFKFAIMITYIEYDQILKW